MDLAASLDSIRQRVRSAAGRAGRDPDSVQFLAVTKTHPAAAADYAARYGLRAVGENRVQEGATKRALTDRLRQMHSARCAR